MLTPLDCNQKTKEVQALSDGLRKRIVGQDEALDAIAECYQVWSVGIAAPGKPVGSFLFLGPTGTGKTHTVEALAEILAKDPKAAMIINCGEFSHGHEISKLVGSPPGYLGHLQSKPMLSKENLTRYFAHVKLSFVVFDEIEKAGSELWNLLLGILDRASMTTGSNEEVDFSETMIFMTGNLGAREVDRMMRPPLGFAEGMTDNAKLTAATIDAARRKFLPEFMNRIDHVVVFRSLNDEALNRILDIELSYLHARLAGSGCGASLYPTESARTLLLQEGTDQRCGARQLKRVLEKKVMQPLSGLVASKQLKFGDRVVIDAVNGSLVFAKEAQAA